MTYLKPTVHIKYNSFRQGSNPRPFSLPALVQQACLQWRLNFRKMSSFLAGQSECLKILSFTERVSLLFLFSLSLCFNKSIIYAKKLLRSLRFELSMAWRRFQPLFSPEKRFLPQDTSLMFKGYPYKQALMSFLERTHEIFNSLSLSLSLSLPLSPSLSDGYSLSWTR